MDKSREKFEEAFEEITGWEAEDYPNEDYVDTLWRTWQASRAAVEIELPNGVTTREALDAGYTCDYAAGMDDGIEGCEDAILAAGLKVKGE